MVCNNWFFTSLKGYTYIEPLGETSVRGIKEGLCASLRRSLSNEPLVSGIIEELCSSIRRYL